MPFYSEVFNRANFNQIEQDVIKYWKENNIFQKSIDKGQEEFIFFEGPPTANGKPGVHHVLARTYKDLVCRFKTMQGYRVERNAGWDEHGLPVEIEVQKQKDLKSKDDIEALGITEFNKLCAESTQKYINDWQKLTERMGYWVNFDKAYRTSDNNYISSVWSIVKHLHEQGLLYLGNKIVPWACDSGTTVSQAEVALGYKDVIDDSAYVKFLLENNLGLNHQVYLVAWTTTPWTLPSNMMLALGANIQYSLVQNTESQEYLILSTKRAKKLCLEIEDSKYILIQEFTGQELLNKLDNNKYKNLFTSELSSMGIQLAEFVEDGEDIGTGIVHIAPAFGQDDYNLYLSLKNKNTENTPEILNYVTPQGFFTEDAPEFIKGNSIFNNIKKTEEKEFKRINNIILKHLEEQGLLFMREKYEHSYPHNWRTGNPLIYSLRPSWYVATQSLRDKLMQANENINWYPGHIKEGRFGKWLENNVDWSISRERYWGTPLPVWQGSQGNTIVIGSIQELEKISGQPVLDPHKHIVDKISWTNESTGETFTRVKEVLDCWFDSGSMPIASTNSPAGKPVQADYICEAIDQTRGWFYSMLALGVATTQQSVSPYKHVLCLGHILDKDGQKMSKSKGNIVDPWELFEKFGADAVRWYFVSNYSAGNPTRFDIEGVNEVIKRFFLQLWNTYAFYIMYANLDEINPVAIQAKRDINSLPAIDQWILTRLDETISQVTREYNNFEFSKMANILEIFMDNLSNIWVRANRHRFWTQDNNIDSNAYYVLNKCLMAVVQLAAPCIPSISDSIYLNLRAGNSELAESVHLTEWLTAIEITPVQQELLTEMNTVQEIINQGRNLRQEAKVKIRQPLQSIIVPDEYQGKLDNLQDLILKELNLKTVEYKDIQEPELNLELNDTLKSEGYARELIHGIQGFRKKQGLKVEDRIKLYIHKPKSLNKYLDSQKEHIMNETLALEYIELNNTDLDQKKVKLGEEELTLALEKI